MAFPRRLVCGNFHQSNSVEEHRKAGAVSARREVDGRGRQAVTGASNGLGSRRCYTEELLQFACNHTLRARFNRRCTLSWRAERCPTTVRAIFYHLSANLSDDGVMVQCTTDPYLLHIPFLKNIRTWEMLIHVAIAHLLYSSVFYLTALSTVGVIQRQWLLYMSETWKNDTTYLRIC